MKTTIELPEDLLQQVQARAAQEGRRLADLVADLLRAGLRTSAKSRPTKVNGGLPVIHCAHPAKPGEEMTPERVAEILWGSGE